jgi:dihydropyrimidinase/allantoinase
MSKVDLVIKGGRIVRSDQVFTADIAIGDGKILGIMDGSWSPQADEVIDASGKVVMAGGIDPHVHSREPGITERDDFTTCTMAAAAGGVTTILEQPISIPPVNSVESFVYKKGLASSKAVVDFALYGGAGSTSIPHVQAQAMEGAVAFKTFLHAPSPGREAEFEGLYATDDGALLDVFSEVAKTGRVQCVHAENNGIIQYRIQKLREQGRVDPMAHGESRPVVAEVEAASRVIHFAKETGVRLNLCHISSGSAVAEAHRAKQEGYPVTVETCPHYLFQTEEAMRTLGPYAKINPPLRSREEQEKLWMYLSKGAVDTIGSDHGPHLPEHKERGWEDIFAAPSGVSGLDTMLPLLLNAVNEGRLGLQKLTQLVSENVARMYGIYPQKGTVQPGSDADLIVVDMQKAMVIDPGRMYTKQREAARLFAGWRTQGTIVMTLVRGRMVMKDGVVVGKPGGGQFVRPGSD